MLRAKEFWIAYYERFEDGEDCVLQTEPDDPEDWTHVVEKAAADKLAEALTSCKAAMTYAHEDHADQYYLNVKNQIDKALTEYRGF